MAVRKGRALLFYHHFGGLGHGTRIAAICRALRQQGACDVLVINSGKPQPELGIRDHAWVIDLPPFEAAQGLFAGLKAQGGTARVFEKRAVILTKIRQDFRPDVAVFEHFPFGRDSLAHEIVPFISALKSGGCRIYSSVRDIIEQKVNVPLLQRHASLFNGILVHSDEEMGFRTSFRQSGELKDKIFYTGRVMAVDRAGLKDPKDVRARFVPKGRKLVVISAGGGIDGGPLIARLIGIKDRLDRKVPTFFVIMTGPNISAVEYSRLREQIAGRRDIVMVRFDAEYLQYVNASDLSISMGGYNSINNALLTGVRTLIMARSSDNEQKIRARYFRGYVDQADLSLTDAALTGRILKAMGRVRKVYRQEMRGAAVTARFLDIACHLKELKVRVSTRCNLACDMCSWKKKDQALPAAIIRRVITRGRLLGAARINLTGGEPTLFPGAASLLEHIRRSGAEVSLSTNGSFAPALLKRIIPFLDHVDISLDSDHAALHDRIRGRRGAFERTLATISALARQNIKPHINVTIRPDNYAGLHRMVPLLAENIRSISFSLVDRTMNRSKRFLFTPEALEAFYGQEAVLILRACLKHRVRVRLAPFFKELQDNEAAHVLARLLSDRKGYARRLREIFSPDGEPCMIPREEVRVNADGAVSVCCFQDDAGVALGNVHQLDLCDIMVSDAYETVRRRAAEGVGVCRVCKRSFSRDYGKGQAHA